MIDSGPQIGDIVRLTRRTLAWYDMSSKVALLPKNALMQVVEAHPDEGWNMILFPPEPEDQTWTHIMRDHFEVLPEMVVLAPMTKD